MKSFTVLRNLYGSLSGDAGATNLTLGDQLLNDGHRKALRACPWLRETKTSLSTTADTQFIELPYDCMQVLEGVKVTISNTVYTPRPAPSRAFWNQINYNTTTKSNIPEWYFVDDNQIGFWPIPSSTTANAVSVPYKRRVKDLSVADYTTGTVAITTATTVVTGTGTTFTAKMVGRYIRLTDGDAASTGDGEWYEVATYTSATVIGLTKAYAGATVTGASYIIGQMSLLPEDYHDTPVNYALGIYWAKEDRAKAKLYMDTFIEQVKEMKSDFGDRNTSMVLDDGDRTPMVNPNLVITL